MIGFDVLLKEAPKNERFGTLVALEASSSMVFGTMYGKG